MTISSGNALIRDINNDFEFLNFNLTILKKILKTVNKNSKKILQLLNEKKKKNFKIFFSQNNIAFSLIFFNKNIQRNLRAAFIYYTCRLKKIKILYWSDRYKFTCFILRNNLSCNELNFLQNYDTLLQEYSDRLNIDINKNLINNSCKFIKNLNLKKNLIFVSDFKNIRFFKKKIKYFLPIFGFEKLIGLRLMINTN